MSSEEIFKRKGKFRQRGQMSPTVAIQSTAEVQAAKKQCSVPSASVTMMLEKAVGLLCLTPQTGSWDALELPGFHVQQTSISSILLAFSLVSCVKRSSRREPARASLSPYALGAGPQSTPQYIALGEIRHSCCETPQRDARTEAWKSTAFPFILQCCSKGKLEMLRKWL